MSTNNPAVLFRRREISITALRCRCARSVPGPQHRKATPRWSTEWLNRWQSSVVPGDRSCLQGQESEKQLGDSCRCGARLPESQRPSEKPSELRVAGIPAGSPFGQCYSSFFLKGAWSWVVILGNQDNVTTSPIPQSVYQPPRLMPRGERSVIHDLCAIVNHA
ncbi:hypothetical protein BDI4_830018 [Burkholderia diffusa]|nr:hypothetical protein BDI4_830018 [Burkholderia diffusa]